MNHLLRLRERLRTRRERRKEDRPEEAHDPLVWPKEPPAAASEAPAAEAGFNAMLYTWLHRQSVFYCSRDLLVDILRALAQEGDSDERDRTGARVGGEPARRRTPAF